jgi:hypothetical protein
MQHRRTELSSPSSRFTCGGIRTRSQVVGKLLDLAPFDLALDSKLRASDLVALRWLSLGGGLACSRPS